MTWDEFLLQFEQHIEGKVDASLRTANRPDDNAADEVAQNVNEEKSDKILKNKKYDKFRNQLLKDRKQIDICKNCTEGTQIWG